MHYTQEINAGKHSLTTILFRYFKISHPMNESIIDFTKVTEIAVIVELTTFDRNMGIFSALFELKYKVNLVLQMT